MKFIDILLQWRRWIRPIVIAFYVLLLLIALPLMIVEMNQADTAHHVQAWFIGGMFVLMAVPISLWGIMQHLVNNTQPLLQRNIIRILWMVPIYAADAWLALRFKEAAIYLDTVRECYEAYVIYNFMSFLLNFLRMEYPGFYHHIAQKPQVNHFFPFCCIPPWKMGKSIIEHCKQGVLQYTVIRPMTTCLALITELSGKYEEGKFSADNAWPYLAFINNASQLWAMYCLVLFYYATNEELRPIKPLGKFMCIKAIIFLTFWQQVFIAFLVKIGIIKQSGFYDVDDVATGLQDFIICVEMFMFAVAHYLSFSHKPYVDPNMEYSNWWSSFKTMWDIRDVRDDVFGHFRHVSRTVKTVTKPLRPGFGLRENENTPLLSTDDSDHDELVGNFGHTPSGYSASTQFVPMKELSHDDIMKASGYQNSSSSVNRDDSIEDSVTVYKSFPRPNMNNYDSFVESMDSSYYRNDQNNHTMPGAQSQYHDALALTPGEEDDAENEINTDEIDSNVLHARKQLTGDVMNSGVPRTDDSLVLRESENTPNEEDSRLSASNNHQIEGEDFHDSLTLPTLPPLTLPTFQLPPDSFD